MVPFFKHNLDKNKNYLKKTLNSSYLTSGPVCEKVESLLLKRFNKKFAILTNSWTNGVISILLSLKLKNNCLYHRPYLRLRTKIYKLYL